MRKVANRRAGLPTRTKAGLLSAKLPQLTAVDVRLPTTRGAIGLIALKDRSLSPVTKLFAQSVLPVVRDIQPQRTLHFSLEGATRGEKGLYINLNL